MSKLGRILIRGLAEGRDVWTLYKDKPFFERLYGALYHSDLFDPIFNIGYAIRGFISNIKRLIEYAPLVWRHRNWDYGYVLEFNKKLHEDLYKGCYEKGHHVFTKNDTRKLKTVIDLYKRLHDDKYDDWQWKYMNKKYGKSDIYFTELVGTENRPGGPYSTMRSTREDRMTPEQNKAYIDDRKRMWKLEEYQRKQDFELLGKYIAKYSKKWWD